MLEFIDHLDKTLLLWINSAHNSILDWLMLFASAKLSWLPLYLFLLWLIIKKYKKKTYLILLFITIALVLSDQSSVHLFKNVFERLRPCHQEALAAQLWLPAGCGGQFGFVSSHAANSFSLVAFMGWLFRNKKLTIGLTFWGLLIGFSRIYLAAHFPSDVIAGSILGLLTGSIAFALYRYTDKLLSRQV